MSGLLSILVKTPGLSPIKTRLAAGIGVDAAEEFFELSLAATQSAVEGFLSQQTGWSAEWRVTESDGVDHPCWRDFATRHARGDGLGAMMMHAYEDAIAKAGAAILIGGDIPQITPAILMQAADAIAQGRIVVGPAADGGFYLIGGAVPIAHRAWLGTSYSRSDTLAKFLRRAEILPHRLARLNDVDDAGDLARCLDEIPPAPSPEQQRLVTWLERRGGSGRTAPAS